MRGANSDRRPKRWFDGSTAQEHLRDGLQLLLRILLLTGSLGCL